MHDDRFTREELDACSVILRRAFYSRPAIEVARDCLGKIVVHGETAGRIVEVEAYLGIDDLAAHASRGLTDRTRVLFGPPGHAYVYFIYGMHECLNFSAEKTGTAGSVLIRALEPLCGIDVMRARRPKARRVEDLTSGPGKLTRALGITRALNGSDLVRGPLQVRKLKRDREFPVKVTPRVGITHCADWPLRFLIEGSRFVSK
ncbi:MAG: DNA-3-methyladenine glycosylase [Bryobacteraceae bacterium]